MQHDYLEEAMLRIKSELNNSSVAGFICANEDPLLIKAIESAINKGYIEKGGQVDGAIVIRAIKSSGKDYLKGIKE